MPRFNILKQCPIVESARINVLRSLMDYPEDTHTHFNAEVDFDITGSWDIGLIVGPSGSGKSTIAKELFGVINVPQWNNDVSLFDNFPLTPSATANLLSSVGLSSVPAWLRPRHLLSGGEGFRADVALSLAVANHDLVVIDEFTSVVDRQVAKAISACLSKHVRREHQQLVCISCHYDVLDWLQPDWVLDTMTYECSRRLLCPRPTIELEIAQVSPHEAWHLFRPHHYMTGKQSTCIKAWCAYLQGKPVGYSSYGVLPHPNFKDMMMGSRLVVLPDYQGLGIGKALENHVAAILHNRGYRVRNRTAHPGAQNMYSKDPHWRFINATRMSPGGGAKTSTISRGKVQMKLCHRITRGYEYVPL